MALGDGAVGLTLMGILASIKPPTDRSSPRDAWQFGTRCTGMGSPGSSQQPLNLVLINHQAVAGKQYLLSLSARARGKLNKDLVHEAILPARGRAVGIGTAQLRVRGRLTLRPQH